MKKIVLATIITGISLSVLGCSKNPNDTKEYAPNITLEQAKEIALNHSELSSDKVKFIRAETGKDDGVDIYEIEFYYDQKEYDYEINAKDGAILEFDTDVENYDITSEEIQPSTQNKFTLEQAREIAVKHANLTSDKVSFGKLKLDNDNKIIKYDIEFFYNNVEYDYEIDANTGEIISYEQN